MSLTDALRHRLRVLFRPGAYERELDEEMRFHLELEAMQQRHDGAADDEAAFAARRRFGSLAYTKEETRLATGLGLLDALGRDARYTARALRRTPLFTAATVLTLALGIGATTAIFSVVEGVLLRPLPVRDADRLLWLKLVRRTRPDREMRVSMPVYLRLREELRSFSVVAAFTPPVRMRPSPSDTLSAAGSDSAPVAVSFVSASFFRAVGRSPSIGRAFDAVDDRLLDEKATESAAIISEAYWRRGFGGDPRVLGRRVRLNGVTYTVVGVMPRAFVFPDDVDLWAPIGPRFSTFVTNRRTTLFNLIGRLRGGVTPPQAQAELTGVFQRLAREDDVARDLVVTVPRVRDRLLDRVQAPLTIMFAFVATVLLIACGNVTNMFLVRLTARRHEIAVRMSLGASRARVAAQLLLESMTVALAGGVAGVLGAVWIVRAIVAQQALDLPRRSLVGINPTVLAFCLGASVLVGLACGLVPAFQLSARDLERTLRQDRAGLTSARERSRVRRGLVVAQVALTIVLLAGAGLLRKSFFGLMELRPGLTAEQLLLGDLRFPEARYRDSTVLVSVAEEIAARVRAILGVESAAVGSSVPFGTAISFTSFAIDGRPPAPEPLGSGLTGAGADYFRTLGTRLRRGRSFERAELSDADVVVVNDAFAAKYFPGEDPIGRRLVIERRKYEIIGVVESVRQTGLDLDPRAVLYVPLRAAPWHIALVVRATAGDPMQLAKPIEDVVRAIDPGIKLAGASTIEALLAETAARPHVFMVLLGAFALTALLLTAIGIFGVVAYAVAQRTREIGVRIALGAAPLAVVRTVAAEGMALTGAGLTLGVALATAGTRIIRTLLYGVSPTDPAVFAAVALLLGGVALCACAIPAWRASRVDPVIALRAE